MLSTFTTLRFVLPLLAAGLLAACATAPPRETAHAAKVPRGGLSGTAGEAGPGLSAGKASRDIQLPAIVAIRRYDDVFRENGADVPVTVEYAWDYSRGIGIERVYSRGGSGELRSQRDLPNQTMNFTDAEMELAFALTREDQRLSMALAEPGLNFYAGFAYLDARDADCSRGSRCVHVIVSGGADGERAVAHAIVDLMQRKVVHPFFGTDNPAPISQIHP